jgi:hypothetical protein
VRYLPPAASICCCLCHLQALQEANLMLQLHQAVVADIQCLQGCQGVQAERQGWQAVVGQDEGVQLSAGQYSP